MKESLKIPRVTTAAVAFLIAAFVWFFIKSRLPEDIRYLERQTGLRFPKGISGIVIERPYEFCFSGRMQLPADSADTFVRDAGFRVSEDFPVNARFGIDTNIFWGTNSSEPFMQLTGRNKTDRWEFAYSPRTKTLWFVDLFPDYHGDPP